MGSFYLIMGLVFSLIIAIMALANNESVTVSYIFGRAEVSLILLILSSAFVGAMAMGLFALFRSIQTAFSFREMRQKEETLQKKVKALEEEKVFLEAELNKALSVPEEESGSTESEVVAESETEHEEKEPDAGARTESESATGTLQEEVEESSDESER
ncbi:MAG: LapA family protein [Bacillota bacterium]